MEESREASRYLNRERAGELLGELGAEFVVIRNQSHVYPPQDICPLAPRQRVLQRGLRAALIDMDGTTTSTEDICLHALETMVRRMTGKHSREAWSGLDPVRDFSHIIGTSTTENVEYLVKTYGKGIDAVELFRSYVHAAAWTLGKAKNPLRKAEAEATLQALGMQEIAQDPRFALLTFTAYSNAPEMESALRSLTQKYAEKFPLVLERDRVRAGIDIYYQRLHQLLSMIGEGKSADVALAVHGDAKMHPVRPLPGLGVLLALLKGWLGEDARACADFLATYLPPDRRLRAQDRDRLAAVGAWFEQRPALVALVTSSARYEAEVVLHEVFAGLREESASWGISTARQEKVRHGFRSHASYYDTIVTASDSHEIRLKPHRDLYAVALHQLGLHPAEFDQVIGFEDTEAGIISMRAAGIGASCAVPFAGTQNQDFSAASHVIFNGFPEVLLKHALFLPATLPR